MACAHVGRRIASFGRPACSAPVERTLPAQSKCQRGQGPRGTLGQLTPRSERRACCGKSSVPVKAFHNTCNTAHETLSTCWLQGLLEERAKEGGNRRGRTPGSHGSAKGFHGAACEEQSENRPPRPPDEGQGHRAPWPGHRMTPHHRASGGLSRASVMGHGRATSPPREDERRPPPTPPNSTCVSGWYPACPSKPEQTHTTRK